MRGVLLHPEFSSLRYGPMRFLCWQRAVFKIFFKFILSAFRIRKVAHSGVAFAPATIGIFVAECPDTSLTRVQAVPFTFFCHVSVSFATPVFSNLFYSDYGPCGERGREP